MSVVAAPLAVEVNRGIAGVIGRLLVTAILAFEALVAGPRFDQRTVDRKVLGGEQFPAAGLSQHLGEQRLGDLTG